ncbi:MAG: ACT domain-containing protein [Clostridia bacterium]|nr:ACT domain-containing protein [Clostridia bacterium]
MRGGAKEGTESERVYFSVTCKNRSGALLSVLNPIYAHGLNMTKIESRPIKDRPDEYAFFIEAEGNYSSAEMQAAISEIKNLANSFKLLGCY